jgi:hypothetical protein
LTGAMIVLATGLTAANSMCVALLATAAPEHRRSSTLNLALLPLYLGGMAGPVVSASLATFGIWAAFVGAAGPQALNVVLARGLTRRPVSSPIGERPV